MSNIKHMLKASPSKNVIYPSYWAQDMYEKRPFLISYTHEGHCVTEQWQILQKSFISGFMFLHLSLNLGVSNVLNILFLKRSKAHSEDVTPGSWEAIQSPGRILPSAA